MTSIYLQDANGTLYLAEQAGVWSDGDPILPVYYEGEEHPEDAEPLYRLTVQEQPA